MVRRVAFRALSGTGLTAEYLRRRVPVAASCIGTLSAAEKRGDFWWIFPPSLSRDISLLPCPIPGAADLSGIDRSPAPEDKLAGQVSSSAPRSRRAVAAGDVAVPFGPSARLCLTLTGWLCAGRAVVGPWCEKYLVLGLEQGLLIVFRKDHRPEALCSDHREGEDKEGIIFLLTGAPNLLPTSLTLNGGYSHHLSSHTLSPIGNSGRLGLLRDSL